MKGGKALHGDIVYTGKTTIWGPAKKEDRRGIPTKG